MTEPLPDAQARYRAVTASDANVVVTAGAGTGKTSLLIDRILRLLTRQDRRLSLPHVVALTFTNKAAREMKLRLRRRLQLMREFATVAARSQRYESQTIRSLQDDYALTDTELVELSDAAMRDVERAHIGTIHSFAGHLLRLYPVEAGVDPSFQEDDGTQFLDHFDREWKHWVERELAASGRRHEAWRRILAHYSLDDVKQLARALTDEILPFGETPDPQRDVNPAVHSWMKGLQARGQRLQARYPGTLVINRMLDASMTLWEQAWAERAFPEERNERPAAVLQRSIPQKVKAWAEEDHEEARGLIRIAQAMAQTPSVPSSDALQLLHPFVSQCRTSFVANGFVSFNGLLARARDLLRDYPQVRAALKDQYHAILVDEFQDTDPVQYELILFLAEAAGQAAREWRDVQLEPGKLFIVGDPKQSIYAFRRADIEAYDTVVQDHVLAPAASGEHHALRGNFRAHATVLEPVNGCCARLFPSDALKGVQPRYERLIPMPAEAEPLPQERVQLRLVVPSQEDADVETATRAEADALAQWLREEVIGKERLLLDRQSVTIQPRHIAVLFRTLTPMRIYLDAFRRHYVPCLTEGERHFFERQEVIDCIHVLRLLTDPQDRLAAVGVLRSPCGGCSDVEVESIVRQGFIERWAEASSLERLPPVFSVLRSLRETVHALPVPEAVRRTFEELPLAELAAASRDGEQSLANVCKLRDMILDVAGQSGTTLRGITRQLVQWVDDPPDEAERSLIEEDQQARGAGGAIRLLSIHKAKGLEFPMVIVAGLQRGIDSGQAPVRAYHDWLTNTLGVRLVRDADLGGIFIEAKLEERQRAEHLRLLYVAMTRAQRRLVLSAGVPRNGMNKKSSFLSLLVRGWALDVESLIATKGSCTTHPVNNVPVDITIVPAPKTGQGKKERPSQSPWQPVPDDPGHQWAEWLNRMKTTEETPRFLSPQRVSPSPWPSPGKRERMKREAPDDQRTSGAALRQADDASMSSPDRQAIFGTLAHRVLQGWDFSGDPAVLPEWIDRCCGSYLKDEWGVEFQGVREELREMFKHFVESEPYAVLRRAEILGKEVPFAVPWDRACGQPGTGSEPNLPQSSCVMEGVIDVIYRRDQRLWLADYKTHHVDDPSLAQLVEEHRAQVQIYRKAVEVALGVPIRSQLIFLRSGRVVEV